MEERRKAISIVCNDAEYFLRHRRIIADRLAAEGHAVSVMTGGRPIGSERGDWAYRYIEIERFRFRAAADLPLAVAVMREALARRVDTLHLITLKPAVVGGLAALLSRRLAGYPKRIVVTVAGLGRLMGAGGPGGPSFARRLVERAVAVLGRSEAVRFTFETDHDRNLWLGSGLIDPARSLVIRGAGVDPAGFHPRDALPSERGPLRVLFASRLLRSKGLDAFLLAAETLAPTGAFEFIVAGMGDDGDPDGYSPETLKKHPAVRFVGNVADMPALLRSVDVVCLPSRYGEGIPRILIEAAACGLPAIASDLAGCREIVADGQSGVLVPAWPPEAASAAICSALDRYRGDASLLEAHGQRARTRFLEGGFTEDAVMQSFRAVLAGA